MSSGGKRIVLNTRERVISPDHNRLQSFLQAEAAEVQRQRMTQLMDWETSTPGALATTVTTPEAGAVLQGLFVIAPLASLELAVAPGMALFVDPDGQPGSTDPLPPNPDDSIGKLCFDRAGVLAGSGTLVFTPNVGPGVRVDVVEIQRNPSFVLETDNRDIFDPATGLFTAATVNKVVVDGIRYRLRLGAPGGGLPANALGWMPIAVICTPAAAVNFDTCVIYDVRPLEADRPSPGSRVFRTHPEIVRNFYIDTVTVPAEYRATGRVEGPNLDGYWCGGLFSVDLRNTSGGAGDVREPGFVMVANQIVYLWALFPGGLPRWVRYSAVAIPPFGGRVPVGTRGILCLSQKPPFPLGYGGLAPTAAVGLPPDSGFDFGGTQFGQLMFAVGNNGVGTGIACAANCDRGRMSFDNANAPFLAPVPTIAATADTYPLNYNTIIPYGARAALIVASARFTAAPGTIFTYFESALMQHPTVAGPIFISPLAQVQATIPAAGFIDVSFAQWVDLITDYGGVTAPLFKQVVLVAWSQTGGAVKSLESARIAGWEL